MSYLMKFTSCLAALLLSVAPAAAQSWIDDVVQVEVLDGGATAAGTHRAALRLTLADGWKTYWRAPGDAGIPPEFSWRGSRNLEATTMTWPTPRVFDQNGMRSIGYDQELVLPLDLEPSTTGQAVTLKGKIDLGVCQDVCIPSTVSFDVTLNPDAPQHPAIVAARSDRPYTAQEAGVRAAQCEISPTSQGMKIEARIRMPSAGEPEYTVTETGNPRVWVSETKSTRQGDTLIATAELVHSDAQGFALDRSAVRFTVLGSKHAVDIKGCSAG